jgi:hypothetical protein
VDQTPQNDFAWDSVERSLEFAAALSDIKITNEAGSSSGVGHTQQDANRLDEVLKVLTRFSSVTLATLWKVKERPERASLIASSKPNDPTMDTKDCDEFSCAWGETDIGRILVEYKNNSVSLEQFEPNRKSLKHLHGVHIDPMTKVIDLEESPTTRARAKQLKLTRILAIRFGSLCSPNSEGNDRKQPVSNYLLNLHFSEPRAEDGSNFVRAAMIEAIVSKLESGVCALINRRLTRITDSISKLELSNTRGGADTVMRRAITQVLPRFIWCEQMVLLKLGGGGHFAQAMDDKLDE